MSSHNHLIGTFGITTTSASATDTLAKDAEKQSLTSIGFAGVP